MLRVRKVNGVLQVSLAWISLILGHFVPIVLGTEQDGLSLFRLKY